VLVTDSLPPLILPPLNYPQVLVPNDISINPEIYTLYTEQLIPTFTEDGDDNNYGSAAMYDIIILQASHHRLPTHPTSAATARGGCAAR
jgi:chorismate mutase